MWRTALRGLRQACDRFLSEEDGQSTVEYILVVTVVVTGSGLLVRGVLAALDRSLLVFGGVLEKDLKTGRASINVWKN